MKSFVKVALPIALAVGLFGTYRFVLAQETRSGPTTANMPNSLPVSAEAPNVVATNHALVKTYANSFRPFFFTTLAPGTVAIDPLTTITCPGISGSCTIEFDQGIQLTGGTSGDSFTFCIQLDGSIVSPGCPFSGPFPLGATVVSFSQEVSGVSLGTHTVQSLIGSSFGGSYGFYTMTYHVYKP